MTGPGAPSLQQPPGCRMQILRTRRLVHGLLRDALMDGARRAEGLALRGCHPPDHLKPEQVRWEPAPEPTDGKPNGPRVQCLIRPPRM